jgi:acyl-CoA dehydrogenase
MISVFLLVYCVVTLLVLYRNMSSIVWEGASVVYLILVSVYAGLGWALWLQVILFGLLVTLIHSPSWQLRVSRILYKHATQSIPKLSKTEQEALNAGETWFEEAIFTGAINWDQLSSIETALTEEEQQFIATEVQQLCDQLDEWSIAQDRDLPESVWSFIRDNGFLGLVISKEFGGKGFSARAHSDIVMKIASRSGVAAVTVMVPNSLGPGELLQYYGTAAQKKHYLPRLAKGIEIPCFALTEPGAGSDATSIDSKAIVVRKKIDGRTVVGLEVTVNKRWITLAPVATLIGFAVNLQDPEGLLKGVGEEGITCILISRDTPNLEIGNRHFPSDQPFMNGSIRGENLFVPMDSIIGGQKNAGRGWQMLVECLSIGRSISLPALGAASSSIAYLTSGAFARIRRQFNIEIAAFEGIQEKLAEIAGFNYLINATRLLTVAAVYQHKKPSVASAITKYFNTELARIVVNHAMDVHAGRAVVVGPRNYLTTNYVGVPISITVEGANIMTRNLLIFGQGSMACHPFIREEFYAIERKDEAQFHTLIWQHIHYFLRNFAKALCSAWTGGHFSTVPHSRLKRDAQRLTRLTYAFAWLADFALIYLGGDLKRRERLSARLADAMSHLYMGLAVLRYHQQEEALQGVEAKDGLLHARWALAYCLFQAQQAMIGFCDNFPKRFLGRFLRFLLFPLGQSMRYPSDRLGGQLAHNMTGNNSYRDTIKKLVYLSGDPLQPVDRMEDCMQMIIQNAALYEKVGDLKRYKFAGLKEKLLEKVAKGVLTTEEMEQLVAVERARWDAIQVDEFTFESMKKATFASITDKYPNPLD